MAIETRGHEPRKGEMLIAIKSLAGEVGGRPVHVTKGRTRVRVGDPIQRQWPEAFGPMDVTYPVEDASAEPGRKRGDR